MAGIMYIQLKHLSPSVAFHLLGCRFLSISLYLFSLLISGLLVLILGFQARIALSVILMLALPCFWLSHIFENRVARKLFIVKAQQQNLIVDVYFLVGSRFGNFIKLSGKYLRANVKKLPLPNRIVPPYPVLAFEPNYERLQLLVESATEGQDSEIISSGVSSW